jgi:hypothetical protein
VRSHNWEYALTQPITDTCRQRAGRSRSFVKDGGTWRSTAGDFARLAHKAAERTSARDGRLIWLFDAQAVCLSEEPNGNRITLGYSSGWLTTPAIPTARFHLAIMQGRISQITDHAGR